MASFSMILSSKLQPTVLVVPCDSDHSRLYNYAKTASQTCHYQCSQCRLLNTKSPVEGQKFAVVVKVINGSILVPNDGEHHPLCVPTSNTKIRAVHIDRSFRLLVRSGIYTPQKGFEQAVLTAALEGPQILAHLGTWRSVNNGYYEARLSGTRQLDGSESECDEHAGAVGSVDDQE